jgi:Ras-related protein Rab-6A
MFMETSAKAGHNVKSLFKKIAMSLPGMDSKDSTSEGNTSASSQEPLPQPRANVTLRDRCLNAFER